MTFLLIYASIHRLKTNSIIMGRKPKIGIVGWFGFDNAGDEAMRDILLKEFPGATFSKRGAIPSCDVYIVAGGMLIQGYTGMNMLDLWCSVRHELCYALSLGVRNDWKKQKIKVERCLSRFKKIYVRDEYAYNELSEVAKIDGVMPDLVLLADAPPAKKKYPIIFNYSDEDKVKLGRQFESVLATGEDIHPVAVIPKDVGRYADEHVSYKKLISMAKSSSGVIGTRLHSVVLGVVAGAPVAGIAYLDKTRSFCEQYNIPCFEYGKSNGREIVGSLKAAEINLDKERAKIRKIITLIKKDIKKEYPEYVG